MDGCHCKDGGKLYRVLTRLQEWKEAFRVLVILLEYELTNYGVDNTA